VLEAREPGVGALLRGVQVAPLLQFAGMGHHDAADGVVGVVPVDEGEIVFVGSEGILGGHGLERLALARGQPVEMLDLGDETRKGLHVQLLGTNGCGLAESGG
jgi:hypothetical protein